MAKPMYATGRRKEAIARVRLTPGSGNLQVNGRPLRDYLHRESLVRMVIQPFEVAQATEAFDLVARVRGGGSSGQAGALRLGVARALLQHDPELRKPLRKIGLLTRDPRMKERKKYGQRGARADFQFSKR